MSEYHYVRTLGEEGGVDRCDGQAIGIDVESVLEDGLPPWKVALEIIAALCEILDIANEDDSVHGDVDPEYIFLDETGAVSLEGYGSKIDRSRAPEGQPRGERTDRFGLGYTAYRLMCAAPFPELPDDDPDAHDDGVIDAVLKIDLSGLPEEMQGDIQWFVAKLMSFDREERPSPVETWRTFIAFSDSTEGSDMAEWCNLALDGEGDRRSGGVAVEAPPAEAAGLPSEDAEGEELEGPVSEKGPLGESGISFEGAGTPGPGATAFWDKDQMKAALEAGEEEEARPAAGGGSATNFWSKADLEAMREGADAAPKPKRAEGEGARRQATMMFSRRSRKDATAGPGAEVPKAAPLPTAPPPPPPAAPAPPSSAPPPPPPASAAPPKKPVKPDPLPVIEGPSVPSTPQGPPSVEIPAAQRVDFEEEELSPGGGMGMILGGVVAVMLFLVCAGLGGGSLFYGYTEGWWASFTGWASAPAVETIEDVPSEEPEEAPAEEPEAEEEAEEALPSTRPRPRPRPSSRPSPRPRPSSPRERPAEEPGPEAAPEAAPQVAPAPAPTGPARVTLRSSGRGSVTCSGRKTEFDGRSTLRFEEFELPATCLVSMGDARGVFQVYGRGEVTCNLDGGMVECDPGTVR